MGPVVVAIDAENWRDRAFQRSLWRRTNPFFPVEIAPYWRVADRGVRRAGTGADAGDEVEFGRQIDWSETRALTAGELVETLHLESREALRAAHEQAWGHGRTELIAPGCVQNTVFLTAHEVLRNWARGGLTALFAHPFFLSMQPGDHWRLAQDVRPKLLIHDMHDPADLELIADFADETVMLSRAGV